MSSPDDDFVDWVPTTSASSPPPPESLRWLEEQLGDRVIGFVELVGGLSSAVHRIDLSTQPSVVLRRFTLADWIEREPYIPQDEARTLALLGEIDLGVATPILVAADPDGDACDVPAIVMTEVQGAPDITPTDPKRWAEKLAVCIARIHEQPPVDGLPRYRRWDDPKRPLPLWTADPDLWRRSIGIADVDLPAHPDAFLHRDFHPNNIHWLDGEICGVVDWLSACTGPIAADLAHCRWNLAVLGDPPLADHFSDHYRHRTGYSEDLQLFDLSTVLSGPVGPFPTHAWNALGRKDLTSDAVAPKIDEWLRWVLT